MSDGAYLDELLSRVRFGKFVSVGVVGATCDMTILIVLTEIFNIFPEIATVLGIETAILVMFSINEKWTFAGAGRGRWQSVLQRGMRSHAVRAVGSLTQFFVFVLVFRGVAVSLTILDIDVWLIVAKSIGIGIGMIVNYVFESLITWKIHTSS